MARGGVWKRNDRAEGEGKGGTGIGRKTRWAGERRATPLVDCTAGRHRSETRHLAVSPLHPQVMRLLLPAPPAAGTAVNFLAMVTSPDLESLSCAHCNPPNTLGGWSLPRPYYRWGG